MLKSWFAAQAEDPPQADNEIEFLEPELAFKILERTPDTVVLRVTTQYGVTHSLSGANSGDSSKRELDLTVRRTTLASASDALAREVASFPQR
jgi:hypothetical protein